MNSLPVSTAREKLAGSFRPRVDSQPVEWIISDEMIGYQDALAVMEARVAAIAEGEARECVWLLEHPPLYTAGTSAKPEDLVDQKFPVFQTGRGGQFTYHGPGQRVAYVMLDLRQRMPTGHSTPDLRGFVAALESWVINALDAFNIRGEQREDRVGVWVRRPDKGEGIEDKIAAIGIRVRRWVSFHGISLNVEPDLSHYNGIVPCGIRGHGVTSLVDLGLPVGMVDADLALRASFENIFGKTVTGKMAEK